MTQLKEKVLEQGKMSQKNRFKWIRYLAERHVTEHCQEAGIFRSDSHSSLALLQKKKTLRDYWRQDRRGEARVKGNGKIVTRGSGNNRH